MLNKFLVFLGTDYRLTPPQIEHHLPSYLSQKFKIVCFEYPRFKKLFDLILGKNNLIELVNTHLTVFHSFGILPMGRLFTPINWINHNLNFFIFRALLKKSLDDYKIITFTPELGLIIHLPQNPQIIYHILDDYPALSWWKHPLSQIQLNLLEQQLLTKISKIITVSASLSRKYSCYSKKTFIFPTPAEIKKLMKTKAAIPTELDSVKKPVIGFIGTMFDFKIDTDLLTEIVNKFNHISFVFLGKISLKHRKFNALIRHGSNIHYLGFKDDRELGGYIAGFDVCIIPYSTGRYGLAAYPVKIMQYLAFGKPVVTTALPAIKYLADLNLIYWAKNHQEFIKMLNQALHEKKNAAIIEKRIKTALKNDWQPRLKNYLRIIEAKSNR